jgi:hypothetical protein
MTSMSGRSVVRGTGEDVVADLQTAVDLLAHGDQRLAALRFLLAVI